MGQARLQTYRMSQTVPALIKPVQLDTPAPLAVTYPRPRVLGKFIYVGDEKLYVKGVTYGTFRPDEEGDLFPDPDRVDRDFSQMAANGINAVRTYTVPPRWLLDLAGHHRLHVMVGLPWEQHIAFLEGRKWGRTIEERVREGVRACAGHAAVLCYSIGNEIPSSIARWHGAPRIERFLHRLYRAAKDEDPAGLVTYVNYPTTEYLRLPFLDFVSFNVYLEEQDRLEAYLARLQSLAGERPLVMAEIGLDSRRNSEHKQAETLGWQLRTAFDAGCTGAFVFSWTDEWHRGGQEVDDWDFGITTRERHPKQALMAVRQAFAEVPFASKLDWPSISVVVCSHNGSATLSDCCEGLLELQYPNYDVIVVDDGSTDSTPQIVGEYGFRVISMENMGLSSARNTGMLAARGDIVAYLDDDARPDPHWLHYLAQAFMSGDWTGVGGPNLAPPEDGLIAQCVANAPGGPSHVLLTDREAEHIPGCNMAFRRDRLLELGGFDPQFRVAGDDVDLCWRLQDRGWKLGFSPAAVVWHHRRNSVPAYWRQQAGYGRAEAMLERKWPEKYNCAGHLRWAGRLYGGGVLANLVRSGRIYGGVWGSAPFQSLYGPAEGGLMWLPLMPEWYLVIFALAALSALGFLWAPMFFAFPLLALSIGALLGVALAGARRAIFSSSERSRMASPRRRALTALLCLLQPLARLVGRTRHGLTPWRRATAKLMLPRPRVTLLWSEGRWQSPEDRLHKLEEALRGGGLAARRGGVYDRWDLEVSGGVTASTRLLSAIEEHGSGKQLLRVRTWPMLRPLGTLLPLLLSILCISAALAGAWAASVVLGTLAAFALLQLLRELSGSTRAVLNALPSMTDEGRKTKDDGQISDPS